jgi:hypothetical protein
MISSNVGIVKNPLYFVFCIRIWGMGSFALKVFNSAKVKSSVNQPVLTSPSIIFVVLK